MNLFQLIKSIRKNYSDHKTEFDALIRTIINIILVLVDMFPGITLITDILETLNFFTRISTKLGYKMPQLTPDVPTLLLGETVLTNPILEILTFGIFPTYAIPTIFQLYKDREKLSKVIKIIKSFISNSSNMIKSKTSKPSDMNNTELIKRNFDKVTDAEIIKK